MVLVKLLRAFIEGEKWQWCCVVKSDQTCFFFFHSLFKFSKSLADLHIDDLLEPEGYDTLPG